MATYQQGNRGGQHPRPQLNKIEIQFKEETYVSEAEDVIKELKKINFKMGREELTTTQIRNLLNLTSVIYTDIQSMPFEDIVDRLAYLRVQFVYQSGRNAAVKKFVELADILRLLKQVQEKKDKKELIRFCRYMEALVAYLKYYGGKDQ